MSRVGQFPIDVPSGVEVTISGRTISVKGPMGQLHRELPDPITAQLDGAVLTMHRPDDSRDARSRHGLARALVANMVTGVSDGFTKELAIVGVGYRAAAKGDSALELQLGYSHPVSIQAPAGVTFEVPEPTQIIVKGVDKEAVGQVAANIRQLRKPEPYKGKGVRYKDEHVRRKAGKAASSG